MNIIILDTEENAVIFAVLLTLHDLSDKDVILSYRDSKPFESTRIRPIKLPEISAKMILNSRDVIPIKYKKQPY